MTDRPDMLADLADAINALTRPRQHHEYLEETVVREVVSRKGKTRTARTRERRKHTTTLPPLLDELRDAAMPGSSELGAAAGGFESRPPAELGPLSVLREISDDAGHWCRMFGINRETLAESLQALVSTDHDDSKLAQIVAQAERWVRRARMATGHDKAPITINQPCPVCLRRSSLVISGDLATAKCGRCGVTWDTGTIGLLAEMLRVNETQETAAAVPCWWPGCTRNGPHEPHQDAQGRTWRDTCDIPDGRLTA